MGLVDAMLGAMAGNTQAAGAGGGLGELIGTMANNPQLLEVATSLLSNDGGAGGLGGLVSKFKQAGLGDVIGSWISTGQNQAISAAQIGDVLGGDVLTGLASKLGTSQGDLAGQLSSLLPELVNHLTPSGQAPAGGLGNADALMGALGSLFKV